MGMCVGSVGGALFGTAVAKASIGVAEVVSGYEVEDSLVRSTVAINTTIGAFAGALSGDRSFNDREEYEA